MEAMRRMAEDADRQGLAADANIDLANYLGPSPAKTVPETAKVTEVSPTEVPDETESTKIEPERAETETVEEESEEVEETEEEIEDESPAAKRLRKDQARLAKNFQEFSQEKQEIRQGIAQGARGIGATPSTTGNFPER